VVKARTWLTLFIISLGTVAATASCGSDEATGTGGTGGGSILGGGRAGSVGRAGSGGSGGNSVGAVPTLGATCGSDLDCGAGLTCITADSTALGSGGPSLGMCTKTCATDTDCDALETGAGCINFGTTAAPKPYCVEACTQGGDSTAFDTKCQGRADVACVDLSDPNSATALPDPFCLPRCRADLECGTGLFCNKRNGLCSTTKRTGDPVGTACDPAAATNACEGICLGFPDGTGKCAEPCSGFLPCMYAVDKPGGLCTGALSANFGPLDQGYCEPNCACAADCAFPGDTCWGWTPAESSLATALGAVGTCFVSTTPIVTGSVELTCGEGGSGGDGGDTGMQTSAGGGGRSGAGGGGASAGASTGGGGASAGASTGGGGASAGASTGGGGGSTAGADNGGGGVSAGGASAGGGG
jgi:hypothetical protein